MTLHYSYSQFLSYHYYYPVFFKLSIFGMLPKNFIFLLKLFNNQNVQLFTLRTLRYPVVVICTFYASTFRNLHFFP